MDNIQNTDAVFQQVQQAAKRMGVPSEAAMTQQILLFGNSFYGYRFTAADFAAIWSAVDQTIKIYGQNEQLLEVVNVSENTKDNVRTLSMPSLQRAA